jgi:hypothetical protein
MASLVYLLCAFTCLGCAALLIRAHRRQPTRLVFWSAICFVFLTLQNTILVVDRVFLGPEIDLGFWRVLFGFLGVSVLLWGLVVEGTGQ